MADEDRHCYLRNLRQCLLDLSRRIEYDATEDVLDYAIFRLRQLSQQLLRLEGIDNLSVEVHNSLVTVTSLLSEVELSENQRSITSTNSYRGSRTVGMPRLEIPYEQVSYLLDYDFSLAEIAGVLGVSESTVKRRVRDYGISVHQRQTVLTNEELDAIVREIQVQFPNAGYR